MRELFKFTLLKRSETLEDGRLREAIPIKDNYTDKELNLIGSELKLFYKRKFRESGKEKLVRDIFFSLSPEELSEIIYVLPSRFWFKHCGKLYTNLVSQQKDQLIGQQNILTPENCISENSVIDEYSLSEYGVRARIIREPNALKYMAIEPPLNVYEKEKLSEIEDLIKDELNIDTVILGDKEKIKNYLIDKIEKVARNYRISIDKELYDKILYYVLRDFVNCGKIEPFMLDKKIEDVSCNGYDLSVYIWHRDYGSLPTNIKFEKSELDEFVIKLTYGTGRAISIAQPVVDATLPDGNRLHATFEKEITRRGSSFTIRKFKEEALTIVDLLSYGTISTEIAAFFWYAIENQSSMLIVGGTASGKTTLINAFSMFIPPNAKIVSIEDTAELQLPHENWLPSTTRVSFGSTSKDAEISLYDLLKNSLRQRPDYIIVGEVRGAEAYTLTQAIATGHGGMATIHGDSITAAIRRLESDPMNVPRPLITTLDILTVQAKVKVSNKLTRRTASVHEIVGLDRNTKDLLTNELFRWDPRKDSFIKFGKSYLLERLQKKLGISYEEIKEELTNRCKILEWLVKQNLRKYSDVAQVIRGYYFRSPELLKKVGVK